MTGRAAGWLAEAAAWVSATGLAAVAVARLVAWDDHSPLVAANALTPLLYLPAWLAAVVAAARRRWPLLALAGAVVLGHLAFALPEVLAAGPVPPVARQPRVRLFVANVRYTNDQMAALASELREAGPDLAVLVEASAPHVAALDAQGALEGLAHRQVVDRLDPMGMVVASRFPLEDAQVRTARDLPLVVAATVTVSGRPVRLWAVHVAAPFGGGRQRWAAQHEDLRRWAASEPMPLLVAGDFNATWGHRPFRRFLDAGFSDAAAARDSPFAMTWPRDHRLLPPFARLDHVLTKGGVVVTRIRPGEGRGSDHVPLVAEVAFLADGPAASPWPATTVGGGWAQAAAGRGG